MTRATVPPDGSGAMFDAIAPRYDVLNAVLSFGLDRLWRRAAVRAVAAPARGRVLDVATGTGDLALALARSRPDLSVTGLDPSPGMLDVARRKLARAGVEARVALVLGRAEELPWPDATFDGVTIAFGIRNVPDRPRALRELARVSRPGARVVVLELQDPEPGALSLPARLHVRHLVPRLGAWLSSAREYRYLERSIAAFPPLEDFARLVAAQGLEVLESRRLTLGVAGLTVARVPVAREEVP